MKLVKSSLALFAAAGLLALGPSLQAQNNTNAPARRGMTAEQRFDRLSERLKLTDEQKPKVKAAMEKQTKEMRKLRDDSSLSREDRRAKMRSYRQDYNKEMKAILTKEQYKSFEEMNSQRGQRRRGQGGGGGGGGGNGGSGN